MVRILAPGPYHGSFDSGDKDKESIRIAKQQ